MSSKESELVFFQLSEHIFALPLACVREIVPMASLTRAPGLPYFLEGFLNLQGIAVPVLRLDRLFRLRELKCGLYTHLIILKWFDHPLALMVDKVTSIFIVPQDDFLPVQKEWTFNECMEAEVRIDDTQVPILSPKKILLKKESERIRDFQSMSQKRLQELKEEEA